MHPDGHTPLSLAVKLGRLQIAEYLIDRGANVSKPTGFGVRPVCLAAAQSDVCFIALFTGKARADLTLCDRDNASVSHYAAGGPNADVLRHLIAAGCAIDGVSLRLGLQPIHVAAQHADESVMQVLLAAGASVNSLSRFHESPLFFAARNANANVLTMLLDAGATVNALTSFGESACHAAAANANDAVLERLIVANAQVNIANRRGETPCSIACLNRNARVLDLLVAAGATLTAPAGTTMCHAAARNRNTAVLKRLIGLGVDVSARDLAHRTPLHDAAASGSVPLLELLLEAGADVTAVDNQQQNACHYAAYNTDASVMAALIARGVDFRALTKHGVSALAIAVEANNMSAVRTLVDAGFDVNGELHAAPSELLGAATRLSRLPRERLRVAHTLRFLLQRGADAAVFDAFGKSPCHAACDAALAELFAFGANLSLVDRTDAKQLPSHCLSFDNNRLLTLVAAGADVESLDAEGNSPASDADAKGTALIAACIESNDVNIPHRLRDWARLRVARRQFELLRMRAFHICVGLHSLNLTALEMCEILANIFAPRESLVPMHKILIVVPVDGGVVSVALNASISSVTNFTATLVGANETAGVSFTLTVVLSSDAFQFVPIVLDSVPSNVSTRFTNAGVGSQAEPRNPQRMSVWSLSPTSNMTASFTIDTTGNRPRVQGLLLSASTIVPLVAPVSFSKDSELSTVFNVSYGERRFFRLQTQPADQTGRFFAVDQCSQPPKANSSAKAAVLKAGWTSFDPDMQGSGDVVFVGAASDYPSIYVSPVRAQRPGTPGFSLDGEALIAVDSSPVDYSGFIPFPQTPDPVGTIAVDLRTIADGFWTVGAASSPLVPFVDGDDLKFVLNVPNLESPLRNASQFRLFTTCDDSSLFESRTSFMMQSRCFLESNKDTLMFTSANKSGAVFEWQINSRDGSSFLVVRNFAPRCPNLSQTVFGTYASIQLTLMFGDAIVWQPVELPTWRANPNQRDDGDGADVLPLWAWIAIAAGGAVLAFLIGFIAGKFRSSRTAQYTQIK